MLTVKLGSLLGQPDVAAFLRGIVARGRYANAYLFHGSHGVGKCTAALAFARAALCERVHGAAPVDTEPSLFGDAPAVSPGEYHSRLPPVPQVVPARPFPAALRDDDLVPAERPPSAYAAAIWGVLSLVGIPLFLYGQWRRWRARDRSAN